MISLVPKEIRSKPLGPASKCFVQVRPMLLTVIETYPITLTMA